MEPNVPGKVDPNRIDFGPPPGGVVDGPTRDAATPPQLLEVSPDRFRSDLTVSSTSWNRTGLRR